jgi:hypothetical protein
MSGIVLDSGALYAVADRDDRWHTRMVKALASRPEERIVPVSALAEACYLVSAHLGAGAERQLVRAAVAGEFMVEGVNANDLERTEVLLQKYADANIGFVDASIVAVAERLKIRTIVTTDRRHFGLLRPLHCPAFDLLP